MSNSHNALAVANLILARDAAGQAKYGTTMDRQDLKPHAWIDHMIEEMADGIQYGQRLKTELRRIVTAAHDAGYHSGSLDHCIGLSRDRTLKQLLGIEVKE